MTASPVLAAFGNPLLDIIVRDGCEGLVEKYGLARNIAQEVDTIKTGLHKEVSQRQASYPLVILTEMCTSQTAFLVPLHILLELRNSGNIV